MLNGAKVVSRPSGTPSIRGSEVSLGWLRVLANVFDLGPRGELQAPAHVVWVITHHQTYPKRSLGADQYPQKVFYLGSTAPVTIKYTNHSRAPRNRDSGLVGPILPHL